MDQRLKGLVHEDDLFLVVKTKQANVDVFYNRLQELVVGLFLRPNVLKLPVNHIETLVQFVEGLAFVAGRCGGGEVVVLYAFYEIGQVAVGLVDVINEVADGEGEQGDDKCGSQGIVLNEAARRPCYQQQYDGDANDDVDPEVVQHGFFGSF